MMIKLRKDYMEKQMSYIQARVTALEWSADKILVESNFLKFWRRVLRWHHDTTNRRIYQKLLPIVVTLFIVGHLNGISFDPTSDLAFIIKLTEPDRHASIPNHCWTCWHYVGSSAYCRPYQILFAMTGLRFRLIAAAFRYYERCADHRSSLDRLDRWALPLV